MDKSKIKTQYKILHDFQVKHLHVLQLDSDYEYGNYDNRNPGNSDGAGILCSFTGSDFHLSLFSGQRVLYLSYHLGCHWIFFLCYQSKKKNKIRKSGVF